MNKKMELDGLEVGVQGASRAPVIMYSFKEMLSR